MWRKLSSDISITRPYRKISCWGWLAKERWRAVSLACCKLWDWCCLQSKVQICSYVHTSHNTTFMSTFLGSTSSTLDYLQVGQSHQFVRIINSDGRLRIRFSAFNKTWSLVLNHNKDLLSSHFAVEQRGLSDHAIRKSSMNLDCYYIGSNEGERLSLAVFSTCQGLVSESG